MKLMTKALEKVMEKYPLYSQDGEKEKKVLIHFFIGGCDWLVLEGEKKSNGKYDFFGLANLGHGFEYGYFQQEELESVNCYGLTVERDLYFKPETPLNNLNIQMM